jgi:hypothetical protein
MRRIGAMAIFFIPLLMIALLATVALGAAAESGDTATEAGEGFGISDFQPGSPEAVSMAVYGGQLYVGTLDWINGCEVWSYNGTSWTRMAMEGFDDPANVGVISLAVFDDMLYAGTMNWTGGCELWRYNGHTWSEVKSGGFGDVNNNAVSCMAEFDGNLYAGMENNDWGCEVWMTLDGDAWAQVGFEGFGDAGNIDVTSMAVFGNRLYAGTHNQIGGCELWRTGDGENWDRMDTGGFGDINNEGVSSLVVYNTNLYAGTWNNDTGCEVWSSPDGAAWSQMNDDGFGDANNVDASSLAVFKGRLYVGTDNQTSGCEVWSWAESATWVQTNADGFGDANNIDAPCMLEYEYFLYVGTRGWEAGCEVWRTGSEGGPPYTDWTQVNSTGFTGATWYLAEGATAGGFETWILVQNPNSDIASVNLTYMTDQGEKAGPVFAIPPMTRLSVNVADTVQTFDVSTKVVADKPVVVERALYFNGRQCATGSIGVNDPATTWYLAEGATLDGFETWVLVQNPDDEAASVSLTYMTDQGEKAGPTLSVPAKSRRSVNVADTVQSYGVSTKVVSDKQVVAERAVYFNGRQCATGSVGVTDPATVWYLAEGATLGSFETWVLVQNPGDEPASINITYMTDTGEKEGPSISVPPKSRLSINAAASVQSYDVSTKVVSDKPVVVERALYYGGRLCATGSIGFAAQ